MKKTAPHQPSFHIALLTSTKGAGLAEYGILVGLLATVSIGAIFAQGYTIKDIFDDTSSTLSEKRAEASTQEESVDIFDPFEIVDQTDWLIGTPAADTALAITNEPGAKGLEGDDVITGTSQAEGFIGGPGNDTIDGGGGNDTFYFAKGDGNDFVSNISGNSSDDRVVFIDATSADVTAGRIDNRNKNLILTIAETGDTLELKDFASDDYEDWIGSYSFVDGPLSRQEMRDKADQDQKVTGTVYGNDMRDNYTIREGEGSYEVIEPGSLQSDDNITFENLSSSQVKFYSNSGQDLVVSLPSGENITHDGTYSGWSYKVIEDFHFTDRDMTFTESIYKMDIDSKETGEIHGTDYGDRYTFTSSDPDHTIREGGGTDRMTFEGYSVDDIKFLTDNQHNMIMSDPNGPDVLLYGGYDGHNHLYIDSFIFDDATLTRSQSIDKMDQDMKATGYIWGSDSSDHYTMTKDDPTYTLRDNGGTNTMEFVGLNTDEVQFTSNKSGDLIATLPSGNSVTMSGNWNGFSYYIMYRHIFADKTLTNADAIYKMDEDSKVTGTIYGTPYGDHYTFSGSDPSYDIWEDSGTDQITFDKPFSSYKLVYDKYEDDLYIADKVSMKRVLINNQNYGPSGLKVDKFIFTDTTMTSGDIAAYCDQPDGNGGKMCVDPTL